MSTDERDVGAFELVTLRNGSRAVRHTGHGEIMHPSVGPWAEANALYVDQPGLEALLAEDGPPLVVMDVGLGAATNAVAVLSRAAAMGPRRRRQVHVFSLEHALDPLRLAADDPAGFPFLVPFKDACASLLAQHAAQGDGWRWTLRVGDMMDTWRHAEMPPADLVLFDPFSPAANPSLWTRDALELMRTRCGPEARVITYSASTPVRVAFLLAGFFVGIGAATGQKRETTMAAMRREGLASPLDARWAARWERSSARAPVGEAFTPEVEAALRAHPQRLWSA